jgi:hypothetical protein
MCSWLIPMGSAWGGWRGEGGAALVAAYVASRTLLSMVVTLGIAGMSGSTRTGVLLRRITGLRTVLLALAALTAALHWAPVVVIAFAAASSSLAGTYRPLQVAIFPWLVRTPVELTSANAVAAVLENSGALAGPLLAGGLLIFAAPPLPMALAAGFVGLATLSLRGLVVPERPRSAAKGVVQMARDAAGGLTELARVAPPGGVAILAFAQTFVRGALVVLIAVLAVKTLALGQSAVGWLTAAIGAGGLVGGVAAPTLVHITRLGRTFVAALLLWGLPLVWLPPTPSAAVAYLALVVVGWGTRSKTSRPSRWSRGARVLIAPDDCSVRSSSCVRLGWASEPSPRPYSCTPWAFAAPWACSAVV